MEVGGATGPSRSRSDARLRLRTDSGGTSLSSVGGSSVAPDAEGTGPRSPRRDLGRDSFAVVAFGRRPLANGVARKSRRRIFGCGAGGDRASQLERAASRRFGRAGSDRPRRGTKPRKDRASHRRQRRREATDSQTEQGLVADRSRGPGGLPARRQRRVGQPPKLAARVVRQLHAATRGAVGGSPRWRGGPLRRTGAHRGTGTVDPSRLSQARRGRSVGWNGREATAAAMRYGCRRGGFFEGCETRRGEGPRRPRPAALRRSRARRPGRSRNATNP